MFKKGDRVKNKAGIEATVKSVPGMEEYDGYNFGDSEMGMVIEGMGWEWQEDWELVEENLVIHCPTQEDYDKVINKIGQGKLGQWQTKETGIRIDNGKLADFSPMFWHKKHHPNHKFITAKEYLGEEVPENREVIHLWDDDGSIFYPKSIEDYIREIQTNYYATFAGTPSGTVECKKPMLSKLTESLKRILKGDLRKQYQAGLINSDSSLTSEGREVMFDALSQMPEVQKALTAKADEIIKESK